MIDALIKLFEALCEAFGLPEQPCNIIVFYLLLGGFVILVIKKTIDWVMWLILWRNQRILNKDLHPYYSHSDVERTTRYYVPVKYQNVAPSEDEELGSRYIASAKNKLIPLLLNKAFKSGKDDNKYYLILADSGMGKTTFMINLYIAYKNAWRSPFAPPRYNIKLLPLGYPNIQEDIEELKDKENTILLLDAFDEDLEAVKDYKTRLNLILSKVYRFRVIVITCRTQFFPSREEIPSETGYFSAGEQGEYKFQKLYLSVFDDKDIKRYLRKRFSIFQPRKFRRAKAIAEKSPNLVVRPMLLSQIEFLVSTNRVYEFSFQVYEDLIQDWIIRESKKPKIGKKYGTKEYFQKALYQFSKELALYLYDKREEYGGYHLPIGKEFSEGLIELSDIEEGGSQLTSKIIKSKSLLNRDALGNYKFSHKSILEFFLAKECFKDPEFYQNFNFSGMDTVNLFIKELLIHRLQKMEGEFSSSSSLRIDSPLKNLTVDLIPKVESLTIINYGSLQVQMLREFKNLTYLKLSDLGLLEEIYLIHIIRYFQILYELTAKLTFLEWPKEPEWPEWPKLPKIPGPIYLSEEAENPGLFELRLTQLSLKQKEAEERVKKNWAPGRLGWLKRQEREERIVLKGLLKLVVQEVQQGRLKLPKRIRQIPLNKGRGSAELLSLLEKRGLIERLKWLERLEHLIQLEYQELKERLFQLDWPGLPERLELLESLNWAERIDLLQQLERPELIGVPELLVRPELLDFLVQPDRIEQPERIKLIELLRKLERMEETEGKAVVQLELEVKQELRELLTLEKVEDQSTGELLTRIELLMPQKLLKMFKKREEKLLEKHKKINQHFIDIDSLQLHLKNCQILY